MSLPRTSRVEEHSNRRDQLTSKDHKYALPPTQPQPNHRRAQRPVSERQAQVERNEVPPSPCSMILVRLRTSLVHWQKRRRTSSLLWWGWIEILVRPCLLRVWVAMLVERSVACFDEVLEACSTAKRIAEHSELYPDGLLHVGGAHGSG